MSRAWLGTQIDAVYHTALVLGGIEYFFGAGVQTSYPGSTHHGQPMEIIPMGRTELEIEVVLEYLESLKEIYTAEVGFKDPMALRDLTGVKSYDLFLHNCNNFTNDFSLFLVGKGIPDHITSLPQTVLNTPFGQMLKPQLDSAMRGITQAPVPPSSIPQARTISSPPSNGAVVPNSSTKSNLGGKVYNVTSLQEVERLLGSAKKTCAVIFFTSSTCAPCKIVYPAYDELAAEAGNKAVLIKVDLNMSYDVGSKYKVRATPTFFTFLNGEKLDEWSGADEAKLRGNINMLLQMAHPPHCHTTLILPALQRPHQKYVIYSKLPPLDKLIAKLGPASADPAIIALKEFIVTRTSSSAASAPLPSLPSISAFILSSLKPSSASTLFPIIDLLRLALVDPRVSGYFAEEVSHATLLSILSFVTSLPEDACPHTLRIVTLQMACNLFTSHLYPRELASNPTLLTPLIALLSASLLDTTHAPVRVSATSLAFNIAAINHLSRLEGKEDLLPDSAQMELVVAILEALQREESKEAIKGLVFALGLLAYRCDREGEVRDYFGLIDAKGAVERKMDLATKEDQALLKEVMKVVT